MGSKIEFSCRSGVDYIFTVYAPGITYYILFNYTHGL